MACERMPRGRARRQQGFVLALVLWMLAAIAIVAGLLTLWALDAVGDAREDRLAVEQELAMVSTRDTLVYLAATRATTVAGLPVKLLGEEEQAMRGLEEFGALRSDPIGGEIPLDGSVLAGLQGVRVAIQDEAGLVSLAWPDANRMDLLLSRWGIRDGEAGRLRDTLRDYIDPDDLRLLLGAERREYEQAGRPPPPNRRLLVPAELERVLEWDELPRPVRERIAAGTTTFYAGPINLNTAPAAVLPLAMDGCPETCRRLVERRREAPFRSSAELQAALGVRLSGDPVVDYRYGPSDTLRLTLWGPSGAARRIHVRLDPLANGRAPWEFLATYLVARPESDESPRTIESALFADAATGRP